MTSLTNSKKKKKEEGTKEEYRERQREKYEEYDCEFVFQIRERGKGKTTKAEFRKAIEKKKTNKCKTTR